MFKRIAAMSMVAAALLLPLPADAQLMRPTPYQCFVQYDTFYNKLQELSVNIEVEFLHHNEIEAFMRRFNASTPPTDWPDPAYIFVISKPNTSTVLFYFTDDNLCIIWAVGSAVSKSEFKRLRYGDSNDV